MRMRLGFWQAVALSAAIHGAIYGGGRAWLEWRKHRALEAMDIDLAHSSLMPLPQVLSAAHAFKPPEDWFEGLLKKLAPIPQRPALTETAKVEEPEGVAVVVCPPPCPTRDGDWAPASQAKQKPQWLEGMISEDDYPAVAREKNITGLVVVQVLLDATGAVRDVRLLQGGDQSLNDKTIEKLRASKFSPCVDEHGNPFPCVVRLPIHWTLD